MNDQTILVNLGVRVIIRPDHALLFEPDTATARRFLAAVEQRQKNSQREQGLRVSDRSLAYDGGYRGIELENGHEISEGVGGSTDGGAAPSDYDLDKTPGGVGARSIPFELEVVEAALQETTSQLYAKMEFCEERCRQVSKRLQSSINPAVLEELRLTKQSLVELDRARARFDRCCWTPSTTTTTSPTLPSRPPRRRRRRRRTRRRRWRT